MQSPLSKVPTTNGQAPVRSTSPRPTVTGRFLAKNQWSDAKRARLAGRLFAGEIDIVQPTLKQLAVLCRLPASSIPHVKGRNGKNGHTHTAPTLAERIETASPAERLEAARKVGIETIWDSMISPIVSEDRAATK